MYERNRPGDFFAGRFFGGFDFFECLSRWQEKRKIEHEQKSDNPGIATQGSSGTQHAEETSRSYSVPKSATPSQIRQAKSGRRSYRPQFGD